MDWENYQSISIEELRAQRGLEKPSTYRETFEILGKEKIILEELADELSDLAGFRNVLVRIYWSLNLDEVYAVLQNDLGVLKDFMKLMKKLQSEES